VNTALRALAWRLLRSALFVLVGTAVGVTLLVLLFERRFIFFPSADGDWSVPQREPERVEEVQLQAADGVALVGWYYRAVVPTDRTLLYFHGNAGNLAHRHGWSSTLATLPANVLVIDYRGYGRSQGTPGEAGIYLDAEAAYGYLTTTRAVPTRALVVYGKSLGGGPACSIAQRFPCAGLILQSTFTSVPAMASTRFPGLPLGWFCSTCFANVERVAAMDVPKLIVHSRDDELIPFRMAEELARRARQPVRLQLFDGAGHNDLIPQRGAELVALYRSFLDEVVSP